MAIVKPPKKMPAKSEKELHKMERDFVEGVSQKKGKLIPVLMYFPQELLDNIDAVARKSGLSRSAWVRFVTRKEIGD